MRGWSVVMLTIVTMAGTSGTDARPSSDVTNLQSSRPGELVVPVMLNDQGPFSFVLDTGSTHTAIAESVAQRLGAPVVAKSLFRSSIGLTMLPIVRLDRVELGPGTDSRVLASVVPTATLDPSGRIAGVIGQDILAARSYTIDFTHRRVIWHASGDALDAGHMIFNLESSDGRFLVEFVQRDSSVLRLIPDSGADGLVLYGRDHRRLPPFLRSPGVVRMSTLTSEAEVQSVRISELRIGPANFVDVPAVLIDRHGSPAIDADGLLPLHLFARVTLDGPGRRLIVE
jgi:predicted aspartyl protease